MRNNFVNYFEFGPVVQEKIGLKNYYLEFLRSSCKRERNHLCNFERGHHGENSCETI